MIDLITIFNTAIQWLSQLFINSNIGQIENEIEDRYGLLNDEELKAEIEKIRSGEFDPNASKSLLERLISSIKWFLGFNQVEDFTVQAVAIGCEAFKRVPADLPEGSFLYKYQIIAATALNERCLIQMNTGEGKTYAILPAAFALYSKHRKVYIICANDYLAERDANRTRNYWNFVGLEVGLALNKKTHDYEWNADIVYTTLDALVFKYLGSEIYEYKPDYPLSFSACIIDEADAVLLDQSSSPFRIIDYINNQLFNWDFAFQFASKLEEGKDLIIDKFNLSANLTEDGEQKLRQKLAALPSGQYDFQIIRRAAELSFLAINVLKEGKHFVVQKGRVFPFDSVTGKVNYNVRYDWVVPLEVLRGIKLRPESITKHSILPNTLIKKFEHISGLSGSIQSDTVEYLFSYWMPTLIIPPRLPKHNGIQEDIVYRTKRESIYYACLEVARILTQERRPVLVGCQNIEEVQIVSNTLVKNLSGNYRLFPILGKDNEDIASVFEEGGEVGTVIVATQLAGRGVDIRLSPEVRQNGGMALVSIGHSREKRHDEQFLGRAGRQGDPFTAIFFISLEDDLMLTFGTERVRNIMDAIGYEEGEVIRHPMITKSMARAQENIRKHNFFVRISSDYQEVTLVKIYEDLSKWFRLLQEGNASKEDWESNSFVDFVLGKFLNVTIYPQVKNGLSLQESRNICSLIIEKTGFEIDRRLADKIADRKKEFAERKIKTTLQEYLNTIFQSSQEKMARFKKFALELHQKKENFKNLLSEIQRKKKEWLDELNYLSSLEGQEEINDFDYPKEMDEDIYLPDLGNQEEMDETIIEQNHLVLDASFLSKEEEIQLIIGQINGFSLDNIESIEAKLSKLEELRTLIRKEQENVRIANNSIFYADYDGIGDYTSRDLQKVLKWSVLRKWMEFLEEKKRLEFKLRNQYTNQIDYYRFLSEGLVELWEKKTGLLPEYILKQVGYLKNPKELNELFRYEDNKVEWAEDAVGRKANWKSNLSLKGKNLKKETGYIENLVSEFLLQNKKSVNDLQLQKIRYTLISFLQNSPLEILKTKEQIQKGLSNWFRHEINEGVERDRRKFNKFWIKKLLKYLNKKGLIGSLPGFYDQVSIVWKQLKSNFFDFKFLLYSSQITFTILIFLAINYWWRGVGSISLSSAEMYMDYWLTGGLLSQQKLTGGIIIGIIIAAIFINRSNIINHVLAILIALFINFFFVWNGASFWTIGPSILGLIVLGQLTIFFNNTVTNAWRILGVDLLKIWLCYTLVNYVIIFLYFDRLSFFAFLGVFTLYFVWYRLLNTKELTFTAVYFSKSVATMENERMRTGYKIRGSSSAPILLSFVLVYIFAFITLNLYGDLDCFAIAGFPVYSLSLHTLFLFLAIVLAKGKIKKKMNIQKWKEKALARREELIDGNNIESIVRLNLMEAIKKVEKQFLRKEICFITVFTILCYCILGETFLPQFHFPISLVVLTVGMVLGELLFTALFELKNLLVNRYPSSFDVIDFSKVPVVKESKGLIKTIKDFFNPDNKLATFLKILIGVFTIVYYIYKLYMEYRKFMDVG